jgi:hypothetical protein
MKISITSCLGLHPSEVNEMPGVSLPTQLAMGSRSLGVPFKSIPP